MERYHATSVLSLTARHPARAARTPGPRPWLDFKSTSFNGLVIGRIIKVMRYWRAPRERFLSTLPGAENF
jgi:hypothetical protein